MHYFLWFVWFFIFSKYLLFFHLIEDYIIRLNLNNIFD